jgi:rhodanese-related sulfurtransferase
MKKRNRVKWGIISLVAILLSALGAVYDAMPAEVPRISIEELKALMDKGSTVTIVDVQPKDIYATGHIKGAISLPYKSQIELEDVMALPEDRLTVVYCDCGPGEADSSDMAAQLLGFGYEKVKVLKDPSIRGWRAAGYPMDKSK